MILALAALGVLAALLSYAQTAQAVEGAIVFSLSGPGAAYASYIDTESNRNGLDPYLVAAICQVESAWHADAAHVDAREGSYGLMQVNTYAHPEYQKSQLLSDPAYAIQAGCAILAESIAYARSHGVPEQDVARVSTAGYNEGEGTAVKTYRAGGDPDPDYTGRVAAAYNSLRGYDPW